MWIFSSETSLSAGYFPRRIFPCLQRCLNPCQVFFPFFFFFLANIYSWAWKSVWVEKMFFLFCITFHKSSLNIFHHSTPIYVTMGIYANVPEGIVHEIFGRKLFFIPSFHVFLLNCISTEIAQWEIEWRNKNSKLFFQKNYIC